MKKEEIKKCRENYVEVKSRIIEEWKDKLWRDVMSTVTSMMQKGIVMKYIQLYKRKNKVWIRIKPELSRNTAGELNINNKCIDIEKDIPWNMEVIEAFKSELGEYFTITDEEELIKVNRLTLFIM